MTKLKLFLATILVLSSAQSYAAFTDAAQLEINNGDLAYFHEDYGTLSVTKDGEFVTAGKSTGSIWGGSSSSWSWRREEIDPGKLLVVGGPILPQNKKCTDFLNLVSDAKVTGVGDNFKIEVKRFGHRVSANSWKTLSPGSSLGDIYKAVNTYQTFAVKQKVTCEYHGARIQGKISIIFSNGIAVINQLFSKPLVELKDCSIDS